MADYGAVITDLGGTARAFLDPYGLKLTRRINGACQLAFSAATDDPKARELLIGSRAVKLYRNGVLVFRGTIGEPFIDEADWVRVTASDPFFFMTNSFVGDASLTPLVYAATDAGAIAWDVLNGAGYETHLREGTIATSVPRDRTYDPGKGRADAVTGLAEVDGGFFYRIDARESNDAGFATFNVLYPDAGVDRPGVRFEYGDDTLGNIDGEGLEVERFAPVNLVVVKGAGEGEAVPTATASDASSQAEYGTWPKWVEVSDEVDAAPLAEQATQEIHAHPQVAIRFNAIETAPRLFDDFDAGDTVRALIDNGRTRFSGAVRVNQATVEPGDDGSERLTGLVLESPTLQAQEVRV